MPSPVASTFPWLAPSFFTLATLNFHLWLLKLSAWVLAAFHSMEWGVHSSGKVHKTHLSHGGSPLSRLTPYFCFWYFPAPSKLFGIFFQNLSWKDTSFLTTNRTGTALFVFMGKFEIKKWYHHPHYFSRILIEEYIWPNNLYIHTLLTCPLLWPKSPTVSFVWPIKFWSIINKNWQINQLQNIFQIDISLE